MYRDASDVWPAGFTRIPATETWTTAPIEESARAYDAVKCHTWYDNLDPTLDRLSALAGDFSIVVDYSAGTGIFTERFLKRHPERRVGLLLVDASPKFLRLAYEKFKDDDRTAFRRLKYLKDEKRLQQLNEVLDEAMVRRGLDGLCSTNAIHLYGNLDETLGCWAGLIKPGGFALIQSGNIDNPDAPEGSWFIDHTVERIQPVARRLVARDDRFRSLREGIDDPRRTAQYDSLRHSYFLPIRPLDFYLNSLREAGFSIESVELQSVKAVVSQWSDFLCAYHEGVLGWAGGCKRVEGKDPGEEDIALRKQLLHEAMVELFEESPSFQACWTHICCRRR